MPYFLDHVEPIEIEDDAKQAYFNEIEALKYLAVGLDHLYRQVSKIEAIVRQRSDPSWIEMSFGNDPRLVGLPVDLVRCSFDWYSVSVCNYVRLIGWIREEIDPSAGTAMDYLRRVVPGPRAWRDMVGAHFERAHARGRIPENCATAAASVWRPLSIHDCHFVGGGMLLSMTTSGSRADSSAILPWSLTAVHHELRHRYWPHLVSENDGS